MALEMEQFHAAFFEEGFESLDTMEAALLQLDPNSPNAARIARWRKRVETETPKADPQVVADRIATILDQRHPNLRNVVGRDARLVLALRALLPWRLFERLLIKAGQVDDQA